MRTWSAALVAVAVLLSGAARATAADRCLQGDSVLGDLRGLADLRQQADASCPCASFTGGADADRVAYRNCARGVRDQAIAAGSLRAVCRAQAAVDYSESTCGSRLVACGRVQPGARSPLECRISSALTCGDGDSSAEHSCKNETRCSDVIDWTASTCKDVRDEGPYGVGVRTLHLVKPSAVNPSQERVLDTVVWYPAAPGSAPVDEQEKGVIDAALDGSGGPYPLVLFSHGSCGYPLQSTFLLPQLASYGFVVVAPPHPGNTLSEYPACGSSAAQTASFVERPNDMIFALDTVLAMSADPHSPLHGAIDPERIAMTGHSFGGLTVYLVQAREPRVKVAIPMAPAAIGNPKLTVPSLTMTGAIDAVVDNVATRAAWERSVSPRYWVQIGDSGHYSFSDGCFPSPDCDPPKTRTQDEAHDAVRRWVLPFLETYLVGDQSWAPFLVPGTAPPDTVLEVRK